MYRLSVYFWSVSMLTCTLHQIFIICHLLVWCYKWAEFSKQKYEATEWVFNALRASSGVNRGTGLQKKSLLPTVRIGFCLCSVMFVHAWPDKGGSEKVSLSTAYKMTLTYIICNLFYSVFACNSERNIL